MTAIQEQINELFKNETIDFGEKLSALCTLLNQSLPHYTWVGFYFADHLSKTLHLGPYSGAETEHTSIPFGKGICGQVAVSNQNFLVPDVMTQDNYIACSVTVKSELVVPLFIDDLNVGQIDIDSDQINAFDQTDERFLEWVNKEVAKHWPSDFNPLAHLN